MWLALALTNSAKPPSTVQPVTCCFEQSVSRPAEQNSHSPQVQCNHGTPTRSPTSNPATPSPTEAMVPVTSCPSVKGNFVIGLSRSHSPIARCKSDWQTPQATTFINTSPGPGDGVGISSMRNGSANECKTAAFKISPQRTNHEETKGTKVFSSLFFVPFVSSWLILIVSGRRSSRHERLLRK